MTKRRRKLDSRIAKLAQSEAMREFYKALKPGKPIPADRVEAVLDDRDRAKEKAKVSKEVGDAESNSSAMGTVKAADTGFYFTAKRVDGSSKGGKAKAGKQGALWQVIDEFRRAHASATPEDFLRDLEDNKEKYEDAFESHSAPSNFLPVEVDFDKQTLTYMSRDSRGRKWEKKPVTFLTVRNTFYKVKK